MGKQLSPGSRAATEQFPYLRVANVLDGRIDYSDVNEMGFSANERKIYALRPGDVLLNEGQESLFMVGRCALYMGQPDAYYFQNTLIRFRPNPARVIPDYAQVVFSHWRRSGIFAKVAEKTSISHLGGKRFSKIPFPLIPLEEQRRIVAILDAVESIERELEAEVAKVRAAGVAGLEEMLARMSWDSVLADALGSPIRNGYSPSASSEWTGVQMLGLGCLTKGGFQPKQLKNAPPEVRPTHSAVLSDGDLLMSRANTRELVGLAGIYRSVGSPCIYPDLMMRLQPSAACDPEFLEIVLRSLRVRGNLRAMAQGTSESMVKLSSDSVSRLVIPLPTPEEQRRLVQCGRFFEDRASMLRSELRKLRATHQGLISDLLG
ncbi:hypothetical protein GXP74_37320 [Streptacidiphilus sp. P02-A3a]|nr:hypothetical protein GXP74_37320 [Streptacidiphilus sp. P02-A3a]